MAAIRHKAALRDAAAAMRGAATATWDTSDYTGKYHIKRIASTFPIPGTQLRREQERANDAEGGGAGTQYRVTCAGCIHPNIRSLLWF